MEALFSCFMLRELIRRMSRKAKVSPDTTAESLATPTESLPALSESSISSVASDATASEVAFEDAVAITTEAIEISTSPTDSWQWIKEKYGNFSPCSDRVPRFRHTNIYAIAQRMKAEERRRREEALRQELEEFLSLSPRSDMVALPNSVPAQ
jgi:hypothetical protein